MSEIIAQPFLLAVFGIFSSSIGSQLDGRWGHQQKVIFQRKCMMSLLVFKKYNFHKILAALMLISISGAAVIYYWEELHAIVILLRDREKITSFASRIGYYGPLFIGVSLMLQIFVAVIPGHPLLIVSGIMYGFWKGFLLSWLFVILATQITFYIARRGGHHLVRGKVEDKKTSKWLKISQIDNIAFYILAFNMPMFPSDILGYVAGLSNISPRKFFIANVIGRAPVPLLLAFMGHYSINPAPLNIWNILAIIIIALVVWVIYKSSIIKPNHQPHGGENGN
ncbi:MAG: VTT domain-containing protein [Chloroflexi bacterium]|nr:VTT domain-containing protein [Chloroflexota bacterium]